MVRGKANGGTRPKVEACHKTITCDAGDEDHDSDEDHDGEV